jgi:hypothetical protein
MLYAKDVDGSGQASTMNHFPPVPEFIDPVFAKKSPFSVLENEHFRLVFAKTGSINSDAGLDYAISA